MLGLFFSCVITAILNLYIWQKMLLKKIEFNNYRLYGGYILMTFSIMFNYIITDTLLKILVVLVIFTSAILYIFRVDLKEALVAALVSHFIYILSEVAVIILVLIITNIQNKNELVAVFSGSVYATMSIDMVVYLIFKFMNIRRCYLKVFGLLRSEKLYNSIVIVVIVITTISVLLNFIYFENDLMMLSIICLMLLIFYSYFVIKSIVLRNNYSNMYIKYNSTLKALQSYEDILDKYKVSNHENKNQLLMIRNMLNKEQKNEVSKYIDNLVENEYKDDEELMMETSKIPAGGLRALIYSKLLYMKNNKIDFLLKVDRKIRGIQLIELDEKIVLDICKIIGVFLDNAIEATSNMDDGSVAIELYMLEDKLNISITNFFDGLIDLDKIDEIKYTTKGESHGYGLTLVKEIINKNPKLENLRKINDNVFTQILRINI